MIVRDRAGGFALVETLLVLVVSSVVLTTLMAGLLALIRALQPQSVTIGSEVLPMAPTFGAFPSAVRLQQTLADRVSSARAIYVFGGRHLSIPADSTPARMRPLKLAALPVIADLSAGLPTDAEGFYERYAGALGEEELNPAEGDFSVAVIGPAAGGLAVTCFVQVRRRDIPASDGMSATPLVVRETRLWDLEAGAQRYAFVERAPLASGVFVGAVHTWYRYAPDGIRDEGPACVAFPDPWLYAGVRGRPDDLPPFSRFTYLLPVSP